MIETYQVMDKNGVLLFDSVFKEDALNFIDVYDGQHGVVLELYVSEREPVDHRKSV